LGQEDHSGVGISKERAFELDRPMSRMICIYHALSHPVRLTICTHLLVRPLSVGEICELLDLKQYLVSQQLAVLRNSDIVETSRVSRHVIYSLRSDAVRRILRVSLRNAAQEEQDGQPHPATPPRASGFARVS
jgi:DNA-binding transcriptional ArsR family regulator